MYLFSLDYLSPLRDARGKDSICCRLDLIKMHEYRLTNLQVFSCFLLAACFAGLSQSLSFSSYSGCFVFLRRRGTTLSLLRL